MIVPAPSASPTGVDIPLDIYILLCSYPRNPNDPPHPIVAGHPLRLHILDFLERSGEATVSEIHEALDVEQAIASQHLINMRDKGILIRRKEGVNVYYAIGDARALKVLSCVREAAC
jgi:DNA-binding transcriptional ArsR family regulator